MTRMQKKRYLKKALLLQKEFQLNVCTTAYTTAATCTIPGVEKIFDAKICGNENYGSLQEQYGQYGLALALSCGDEM